MSEVIKIAVVSDDGLTINRHFGPSRFFEVITLSDKQIVSRERREKKSFHAPGQNHHGADHTHGSCHDHGGDHSHGSCHDHGQHGVDGHSDDKHNQMIGNIMDCQYMISCGMGYGIYNALENAGIQPIVSEVHEIDSAINAFISGELKNRQDKLH